MNLALEFASVSSTRSPDGRLVLWIANGPVACELDLFAPAPTGENGVERRLCEVLLRHTTRLLSAPDPSIPFVPTVDAIPRAWQIGLRLERIEHVKSHPPSAREEASPGENVVVGDPAFRLVFIGAGDSATLRTDRVGIESLDQVCRAAGRFGTESTE
jgi:hypothetical protein